MISEKSEVISQKWNTLSPPLLKEGERELFNEKGIALVMVLVLSTVALLIMAGLIYMLTVGTQLSGMQKRYKMQVSNLPQGAVVETYGVIDATGPHAIASGDVPAGLHNILGHHVHQQEMTVQAALQGSRELALQVLLGDPLSSRLTISQAEALLEEMLAANRQYLPLFF